MKIILHFWFIKAFDSVRVLGHVVTKGAVYVGLDGLGVGRALRGLEEDGETYFGDFAGTLHRGTNSWERVLLV